GRDERLPPTWQRLLDLPRASGGDEPVVLGFFLEVMPEEGAAWAHLEVAPVLLAVAEHGRYARPVPLDSRHLVQAPLPPHEQRLAAAVLGLPQTQRKGRSYARQGAPAQLALAAGDGRQPAPAAESAAQPAPAAHRRPVVPRRRAHHARPSGGRA